MECPDCNGECKVIRRAFKMDGIQYPDIEVDCFRCDGRGELCDSCGESVAVCDGHCRDEE